MLSERIAAFVAGETGDGFDALAGEAFALHFEHSPPLRRLAAAAGLTPETLENWRQVPLIPTLAFKTMKLAVAEPREIFRSSGTTNATPSVHHHPYPELYRAVIDATFPKALLGHLSRPPMLSLVPSREDAPESSLAFMIEHVLASWAGEGSRTVAGPGGVEARAARGFLAARQRDRRPTVLLSTAFALVQLIETLDRLQLSFRLPVGSRVFETGGYKGKSRELDRPELLAALERRLGIPPTMVVTEYGMTELTSHFYSSPRDQRPGHFAVPPWVRLRVLDPETLSEVRDGESGLLAIFDLANVGSAIHLLTEDVAIADDGGFRLVGRAASAELRGCSLLSEELAG
ncbi:MAG: hypothetical protein O7A04_08955 [Acidobacteria bacterium]|nr:hypothetical protein [Acidobacteriota bacterium]